MISVLRSFAILLATVAMMSAAHAEILRRGNSAEPNSLDPMKAQGNWEATILGDLFLGLTTEGPGGEVIPGAAESWTISEDGLTWTFKLRPGQSWSDGEPFSAGDFVFAWRRMADPKSAAPNVKNLYVIAGVEKAAKGEIPPDRIGVAAPDPLTLIVTLEHPASYLPRLLAHYSTYPVPRHLVETQGDGWAVPGLHASNGPYLLAEWRPQDYVRLTKNPFFYDTAAMKIDEVLFIPNEDASAALKRFRAGEIDINAGIPVGEYDWIKENIPDRLQVFPTLSVQYLVFNVRKAPLNNRRVREALALGYDRLTITRDLLNLDEEPAFSFVPPIASDYPGGAFLPDSEIADRAARIEKARALLADAGYGPGGKELVFTLHTGSSPDTRRVATAIQAMWDEIGARVILEASDIKVLYATTLRDGSFDAASIGWVADYDDAESFLALLESSNAALNYGGWSNPDYDALMDQSRHERDAAKRGALMAKAEQIALDDYAVLPTRHPSTRWLVRDYVKGFAPNFRNQFRTRWLSIEGERGPLP